MLFGDCCGDDIYDENENPDGVSSQECDEDQNGDNEPMMSGQRENNLTMTRIGMKTLQIFSNDWDVKVILKTFIFY